MHFRMEELRSTAVLVDCALCSNAYSAGDIFSLVMVKMVSYIVTRRHSRFITIDRKWSNSALWRQIRSSPSEMKRLTYGLGEWQLDSLYARIVITACKGFGKGCLFFRHLLSPPNFIGSANFMERKCSQCSELLEYEKNIVIRAFLWILWPAVSDG